MGLGNVAQAARLPIGALRSADDNLRHSIALCRETENEFQEAVSHLELGRLLAYCGEYAESETELAAPEIMCDKTDARSTNLVSLERAYHAQRELLLLRTVPQSTTRDPQSAISSARHALELLDETARTLFPSERDYVRAHWLLGAGRRVAGEYREAERDLHEALERCRQTNMVEFEGDILIDLARLRAATGAPEEANRLAQEVLLITERSSYVLQGADAHLELAKLAIGRGERTLGLEHAQKAKELATCDGVPGYTYKAAYDEACALLEGQSSISHHQ